MVQRELLDPEGEDFSGDADITLTAVDLDGSAPTVVQAGGVPSFNRDIKNFILVGLGLPEPGCWEVTARYQGAELTYVLLIEGLATPNVEGMRRSEGAISSIP